MDVKALGAKLTGSLKALVGLIVIVVTTLVGIMSVGNLTLDELSLRDWLTAGAAALGSAAGIALIDNIAGIAGSVAKAAWTAATAGVASLLLYTADESALGARITQHEWLAVFLAAVIATGFVYQTPDKKPGG